MSTVQRIILLPSSVLCFFSLRFFLFLSHHISRVSHLSFFCCVLSTSHSLFISFPRSISLSPPFEGSILNLASMPVLALSLPLREAGGQAEEPLFSRPFLWMKRWNKGMKALGKVWKLPIHQCKEILRWQLADGQPSTTRDSRVGLQCSPQQTDRARPDQTPHSSLFEGITYVSILGIYSDSFAQSDSSVNSRISEWLLVQS